MSTAMSDKRKLLATKTINGSESDIKYYSSSTTVGANVSSEPLMSTKNIRTAEIIILLLMIIVVVLAIFSIPIMLQIREVL